jgi:hypothetical protein
MPRTPIDYSKTIIYKLVHKDDYDNANIYIGNTTDFRKRKNSHNKSCNNEKDKGYNDKKYQYIRENGGWDCFNLIEIEKYPCNDGNEARAREEYWRSHFNAQLNMVRPYITEEQKKEYKKKYTEQHKHILTEYKKEHYKQHKNEILEYRKKYYKQHKDEISEQTKKYREQHKEKISEQKKEKISCECGCIIRKDTLTQHRKSQKHLTKIGVLKYEFVNDDDDLSLPEGLVHC